MPHALLTRPTTEHARGPTAAASAVWSRVDALAASPTARGPFRLLPSSPACTPAVSLAAACPDLFLVDAADGPAVAACVATEAVRHGQRVLVLAHDSPALNRLARTLGDGDCGEVVRAVGLDGESGEGAAPTSAELARGERAALVERLTVQEQGLVASGERTIRLREQLAAGEGGSPTLMELAANRAKLDAEAAALRDRRSAAERELAAPAPQAGLGGFFKKLFRGADDAKHANAEVRLKALDAELAANATDLAANDSARQAALADLARERDRVSAELAAVPDDLHDELNRVRRHLADLTDKPPVLSPDRAGRVRIVVASPEAIGVDPLLTPAHPEVMPLFDRMIVADADALTPDSFEVAARLAAAWVLVGTAPATCCNAVPRTCAHSHATHLFDDLWRTFHAPLLLTENDRPLARLVPTPADRLTAEPLADRPEVELRFASAGDVPVLAEVLFPAGTSACEAKRFLAVEAGHVRLTPHGEPAWADEPGAVACRWPLPDDGGTEIDLGDGVREQLSSCGSLTLALRFDRAAGWTGESAAEWLDRHAPPHAPRTAVAR